jgi:hypothetical protein
VLKSVIKLFDYLCRPNKIETELSYIEKAWLNDEI